MKNFKKMLKKSKFLNMIFNSFIILPTPMNINYMWNFGSILGMFLMIQIISGFLLSMHYCANIDYAFKSIIHIMKDINSGWLIRDIHMNGASFYFMCLYIHISRNLFYQSYFLKNVWNVGIIILFMSMASAFMGYVLPWGQMSFWGATVITNLLSAIPFFGQMIVEWIWGGFSINNATLNRFFSFHFMLPLMVLILVILHLYFLHISGSNNPIGTNSDLNKIPFHPYFSLKDLLGFIMILFMFFMLIFQNPNYLSDPDNFIPANSMNTPNHIKPEWYFLFAYSILRTIPNKLGGVLALMMSIMILFILPFMFLNMMKSNKFYPLNQLIFWMFINIFIMLTWLGSQMIENPYIMLNFMFTNFYFLYFYINFLIHNYWDKILF